MCGDGRTLPGLPHGVQSRLWCPCLCGRAVSSKGELHHQNSTPNCSQLGVFICASRMTRGVPAHSACASGWSDTVPMEASSTLFCPLFSRNLCQLFRRSTRTSPCTTTSCACVDFSSLTTCLDKQTIRQKPSSGTRTASSTNPRVYGTPRALRRHGAGPRIAASLCRGASP